MSKKVVQFQNGIISEKTSQRSGSIPEWNPKQLLVAVEWFNSLELSKITLAQSQQDMSQAKRNTQKRKGGPGGGAS